jgi:hypothetical protein
VCPCDILCGVSTYVYCVVFEQLVNSRRRLIRRRRPRYRHLHHHHHHWSSSIGYCINFCIYAMLRTRATFPWPILYNSTPEGNICLSDDTDLSSIPIKTTRNFRLLHDSHHPMQETEGIRKDTFINRYYSVHIYRQTTTGWNIRFPCVTKSLKFEVEVRIAVYDYLCYKSTQFLKTQHSEYLQAYINIYKRSQNVSVKCVCNTCQGRVSRAAATTAGHKTHGSTVKHFRRLYMCNGR